MTIPDLGCRRNAVSSRYVVTIRRWLSMRRDRADRMTTGTSAEQQVVVTTFVDPYNRHLCDSRYLNERSLTLQAAFIQSSSVLLPLFVYEVFLFELLVSHVNPFITK